MNKERIIGLLTDFGVRDGAVGTMKAVIKSIAQETEIIDISHEVKDIEEGAFILATSHQWFPEGTIFVAVVDPGVGTDRKAVIIETEYGCYFVGPDNGIFSFISEDQIEKVVELTNRSYWCRPVSSSFHGRDIFAPVGAYLSLARGAKIEKFGELMKKESLVRFSLEPKIKDKKLIGKVLFIDDFGNLITSISRKVFDRFYDFSRFQIKIGEARISHLSRAYAKNRKGELIALFGGDFRLRSQYPDYDLLEIAVNQGNAAEMLGAKRGDKVIITLNPK